MAAGAVSSTVAADSGLETVDSGAADVDLGAAVADSGIVAAVSTTAISGSGIVTTDSDDAAAPLNAQLLEGGRRVPGVADDMLQHTKIVQSAGARKVNSNTDVPNRFVQDKEHEIATAKEAHPALALFGRRPAATHTPSCSRWRIAQSCCSP